LGALSFSGYWRLAPIPEDEGDDDDEDYAEDDSEPHLSFSLMQGEFAIVAPAP
jgi:hypothetical protein